MLARSTFSRQLASSSLHAVISCSLLTDQRRFKHERSSSSVIIQEETVAYLRKIYLYLYIYIIFKYIKRPQEYHIAQRGGLWESGLSYTENLIDRTAI